MPPSIWFERLTGFVESDYEATRSRLSVEGDELVSSANGKRYGIGTLRTPSLGELRAVTVPDRGRTIVTCTVGDVGAMHSDPEFEGALFQVASQFNLLEMTHYTVTPEDGVTRYAHDHTQGPACAIAAGAGTIYRNYFASVHGQSGQTADRQLNMLERVGLSLSEHLGLSVSSLWRMENGYALCTADGLAAINDFLAAASPEVRDALAGELTIGLHLDVEVTEASRVPGPVVSQAYCSALPVAYSNVPQRHWEGFARLVLESAYEATLLAAVDAANAGGSNIVLLTRLGGGVFGNADEWIDTAILRALSIVEHAGLDVRLVSYGSVHPNMRAVADKWA
ncbi:hypothetical protein [Mycolicibacterium phocaicum]|uniref:Uncharacterized protein n=1 Tax=Mycolicibacterium phocaicum TaxID=319706 RepID=A0A7I7ZMB0_9MYCO|nr:hypothetical protein [Mycolicibacterium phocaicum]TLH58197.1 hypothetical protein C1S79_27935 [Mycolicibacterium phocaicum]BBZ55210.1 hypothetical protein MPHO_22020 [Mycolicibacterium phocaicum]